MWKMKKRRSDHSRITQNKTYLFPHSGLTSHSGGQMWEWSTEVLCGCTALKNPVGVWMWVIHFLLRAVFKLLSDLPHLLLADEVADTIHGGIAAEFPEVTARVTLSLLCDLLQINGIAQLRGKKKQSDIDSFLSGDIRTTMFLFL